MADREYKIQIKIEGDAGGSAPVDAGLKRVEQSAKSAEAALKDVEQQSRRTDAAVQRSGGGSPGAQFGVGQNGLPLPDKVRSWHTPEEAAAIQRAGAAMRATAGEAAALEAASLRAGTSVAGIGGGATIAGVALAAIAAPIAGAKKELGELGSAVGDLVMRFARASSEGIGLPKALSSLTQWVKNLSAAAAEERGEEQKLANAKLDTALARQKAAMEAEKEKQAVDQVTQAINQEIAAIEKRALRLSEGNKQDRSVEDAQFENERARLANSPGLSREERAAREADIDRRQLEARQARTQADLERRRADENAKVVAAEKALELAEKSGSPAAIKKAAEEEAKVRSAASVEMIRIKTELSRLEEKNRLERDTQRERSEASIRSAREVDSQEVARGVEDDVARDVEVEAVKKKWEQEQRKKGEKSNLESLRDSVLGGMGSLRGEFATNPQARGVDRAVDLVSAVEKAARDLERGGATGTELEVFNQAMQRLAVALSQLSPRLSGAMRAFRAELEPRIMKIEEDLANLNLGSTK